MAKALPLETVIGSLTKILFNKTDPNTLFFSLSNKLQAPVIGHFILSLYRSCEFAQFKNHKKLVPSFQNRRMLQ